MTQNTQGPWTVGPDDEPLSGCEAIEILAPYGDNGGHVCIAYVNGLTESFKINSETRANANLFASSLDLLAALIEVDNAMMKIDGYAGRRGTFDVVRAAISKATGGAA